MSDESRGMSLGDVAGSFLGSLSDEEKGISQQEVCRFARWYGWERPFSKLAPHDIDGYAQRMSRSDADYTKKLKLVQAFLAYAKKQGWCQINLAVHLKARRGNGAARPKSRRSAPEAIRVTRQGYDEMEAELAALKEKRPRIIEEITNAAADKDFRENAPLDAAKEQHGQLEGRIMEMEQALKLAVIINDKQVVSGKKPGGAVKVGVGYSVVLLDLVGERELRYTLVGPREVDPAQGRISSASPIGKAVIGRGQGEVVEVAAPAGKLRYEIKKIER